MATVFSNTFNFHLNKKHKTILVLEDSPMINKIIEKYLKDENYNLIIAKNAFDALDILEVITPDLILLDIMLPMINGFSFLKLVKIRHKTKNIPVVMISSLENQEDIDKSLALGAKDYLKKPFNSNDLKNLINYNLITLG